MNCAANIMAKKLQKLKNRCFMFNSTAKKEGKIRCDVVYPTLSSKHAVWRLEFFVQC